MKTYMVASLHGRVTARVADMPETDAWAGDRLFYVTDGADVLAYAPAQRLEYGLLVKPGTAFSAEVEEALQVPEGEARDVALAKVWENYS